MPHVWVFLFPSDFLLLWTMCSEGPAIWVFVRAGTFLKDLYLAVESEHLQVGSSLVISIRGCSHLLPTSDLRVPKPHILTHTCYDETLFFVQPVGVKRHFIADWISISLSLMGLICISICLLVTRVFSSAKHLFISFVTFLRSGLFSLFYYCEGVLYILNMDSLLVVSVANIFSWSVVCFFTLDCLVLYRGF